MAIAWPFEGRTVNTQAHGIKEVIPGRILNEIGKLLKVRGKRWDLRANNQILFQWRARIISSLLEGIHQLHPDYTRGTQVKGKDFH